MRTVFTLIDEAAEKCGSFAALARTLDVSPHHPHEWKRGDRAITPALVGRLCDLMNLPGSEAQRLAAEAVILSAKDSSLREVLRRAFFGSWAALGIAATLTAGGMNDATAAERTALPSTEPGAVCILCEVASRVRRWLRAMTKRLAFQAVELLA
jgi:hypothetical protein